MKAQDSSTDSYWSSLPRPTLTQGLNIYSAYNSFGAGYAGALACTSLGDGYLSTAFGGRNYFSLSVFWSNIAYNAVSKVQNSNLIPSTYKIPLNILFTAVAAGMVWKGGDIFEEKHDLAETTKAVKLTASFFDDQGTISTLESEFNKGYMNGIIYGFKNVTSIIANKFVSYNLLGQALHLVKSFVVQNFFNNIPQTDQVTVLLQLKDGKGMGDIVKACFIACCKQMVDLMYEKISGKLTQSVKNEIDQKVAKIALAEGKSETVVKLGNPINQLPNDINAAFTLASKGVSSISDALFFNQLFGLKTNTGESFYNKYPTLVLLEAINRNLLSILEAINRNLLSSGNIMKIKDYLEKKIYGDPVDFQEIEGTEAITCEMGNIKINTISCPTDYTYQNIQEIAKLGGNKFMLSKVIKFLENSNSQTNFMRVNSFLSIILTTTQNLISNLSFAVQLPVLELPDSDLQDVLGKLTTLAALFQEGDHSKFAYEIGNIDRAISTLSTLKNPGSYGVTRTSNDSFTLSLKDYHLKKVAEEKDMLYIPEINLTSGKVYAISGVIGTGKTTLLTDIAKCMISVFSSSGSIKYPVYKDQDGQYEVPMIFCGTVAFSPPATTLLERVTYRLPEEYRLKHKDELLYKAKELFKSFGQDGFDDKNFLKIGNDDKIGISTGQSKLVILIAAILYKQYLKSPVLFVIDETLANLDISTSSLVCKKIKEVFKDSLVLSVDHNYANNTAFYNTEDVIDLSKFKPVEAVSEVAPTEVAVIGEESSALL